MAKDKTPYEETGTWKPKAGGHAVGDSATPKAASPKKQPPSPPPPKKKPAAKND